MISIIIQLCNFVDALKVGNPLSAKADAELTPPSGAEMRLKLHLHNTFEMKME